jgi:molybdate transport system substrate-binding protein
LRVFQTLFLAFLVLAGPLRAEGLLVFAAASLSDPLQALGASYQRQSGVPLSFNFGASNLLARQILEGAPADLFASADETQMDRLQARGLVAASGRRDLLSNLLVTVALKDSPLKVSTAAGLADPAVSRIAVADPRAVPNGVYARQYFKRIGLWQRLSGKVIPTENVRASLQAVESGNVDAAVVYQSDALTSRKVRVLFQVAQRQGPRILYPFAVLRESAHAEAARRFLDYLATDQSLAVFLAAGFLKPAGAP